MKKNILFTAAIALSLGLTGLYDAPSAKAGFEWHGLPNNTVAQQNYAFPTQTPNTTTQTPHLSTDGPTVLSKPVAPVERLQSTPLSLTQPVSIDGYYGFGNDLPLSIALREIVPANLDIQYDPNVSTSTPVSWQGDGQWQTTLQKALQNTGLTSTVIGDVVRIERTGAQNNTPVTTTAAPINTAIYQAPHHAQHKSFESRTKSRAVSLPIRSVPEPAPLQPIAPAPVTVQSPNFTPVSLNYPSTASAGIPKITQNGAWYADANDTLRDTLQDWSRLNGTKLFWTTDYNYRLKRPVSLNGDFNQAVKSILDAFKSAEPRPYAELIRDNQGQQTLVVRAYGVN